MTKEITKAIIIQEIENKFKLRDFDPAKFLFDETVVPIYDIESHLAKWRGGVQTKAVTSIGGLLFFTVPQDEFWTLRGYNVIFITGVYTVAGVYLYRPTTAHHYMDLTAAQSVSYAYNLPENVQLNPGDSLNINIDGYTSTGDLTLRLDYKMEKIR